MDDVRLRRPERSQYRLESCCIDDLVAVDHPVRVVWHVVEGLDLSKFLASIRVSGSEPGRASTDPRLLIALWLYATSRGVGHGRELARLCTEHNAYRWLCGDVSINYHTLNDFRVNNEQALDHLLTQMLAALTHQGLVSVKSIAQDGTKVEARASKASFARAKTLEEHHRAARHHLKQVKKLSGGPAGQRGARDRVDRLEKALVEIENMQQAKLKQRDKPSKHNEAQASPTDPQARLMRTRQKGFAPCYNVQLAVDPASSAIVGVDVTNAVNDVHESEPMRRQVEKRTGQRVHQHILDAGYVNLNTFERAEREGVKIYSPPRRTKGSRSRYEPMPRDSVELIRWRHRMGTPEGQAIYAKRGPACERVNADLKTYRGLGRLVVCGLGKVKNIALWSVLAYNVMTFGKHCVT